MQKARPYELLDIRTRSRGVALIEAMVTSLIVGGLTALAAGAGQQWLERTRFEGVSDALMTDLRQARSEAIRTGLNVKFGMVERAEGTCYLIYADLKGRRCECDSQGRAICPASAILFKSEWVPSKLGLSLSSNVTQLYFKGGDGTVTPTASIELVADQGRRVRHVISIMGRTRRCMPDGQQGNLPRC